MKYDDGTSGLDVVAEYRYESQGRRIEFIDSVRDLTTRYYYDGSNVIIETDESDATQRSYVNGSQYIDERVLMRDHTETIGPGEDEYQDHYYLLAELYSVAGLAACNGLLEETYTYDTYGHVTLREWPLYDVNFDGVTNALDRGKVKTYELSGEPMPSCDVNVDGIVNALDRGAVKTVELGPDCETVLINYSSVDNPYFFTGRITDTLHADDLLVENDENFRRIQDNRNRTYDPKHGRWLQRDPLGVRPDPPRGVINIPAQYTDGMSLQEYCSGRPGSRLDPHGLWGDDVHYDDMKKWAEDLGYLDSCADIIAKANKGVDAYFDVSDNTSPMWLTGDWRYHFDVDQNGQPMPGARSERVRHHEANAARILRPVRGCCERENWPEVKKALKQIGISLHPLQDMWSHNARHTAANPVDHAPWYHCCLLWGDCDGTKIGYCINARKTNPNWADGHRPDDVSVWPEDHGMAKNVTDVKLKVWKKEDGIRCHCILAGH